MKSRLQLIMVGCNVKDHDMEPTAQGTLLRQQLCDIQVTNFSSLCRCSRVQIFPLQRGGCYPRPTSCMTTTHTTWECIHTRRQISGCTMVPILFVIRAQVPPSPKGVCGDMQAMGCTMKPNKFFPAGRCLQRRWEKLPTS